MKYIKTYEKLKISELKLGDYVIIDPLTLGNAARNNWFNHDTIGQIIEMSNGRMISVMFDDGTQSGYGIENFKYWSKNRKELEIILAQNKYNL